MRVRRVGKVHCASGVFQIGAKVCAAARLPPTDSLAGRKIAGPRALTMRADARSRGACLNRLLAEAAPCFPLSAQALQLTLRYRTQGASG